MNVALYARVSSERQAEKDLSIPAQLKALRNHALKNGWEIVREFVDEAESARTANRPAFQEMVSLAKQKLPPFQAILVWKLSRFARNREDSIVYKAALRKRGIQVVSINEQIDESPTGRLLEGLIETIDEFYSANLGQDTRRGMKENAQRGFLNGARLPYGYNAVSREVNGETKRVMEINDAQASAVKRAFELAVAGEGAKAIAQTLSSEGYRTKNGARWSKPFVGYMLRNEVYTGTYVWNRIGQKDGARLRNPVAEIVRIENHHPAIIDADIFAKVQRLISERAPKQNHPRAVASQHALSGIVYCGHCGSRMSVSTAKSGQFFYYSCKRRFKEGKASCCQRNISATKLEPIVLDTIRDRLLSDQHLSRLANLVNEELRNSQTQSSDRVISLRVELENIEKKIRRYYTLIESEGIRLADIAPRLGELNAEKRLLSGELSSQQQICDRRVQPLPTADAVRACVMDLRGILARGSVMQRKSFLRSFVRRVGIRDNEAEIEYSCPLGTSGNGRNDVLSISGVGDPTGTRTRAAAVKGQCPNR